MTITHGPGAETMLRKCDIAAESPPRQSMDGNSLTFFVYLRCRKSIFGAKGTKK
jgi:hypothetical protein